MCVLITVSWSPSGDSQFLRPHGPAMRMAGSLDVGRSLGGGKTGGCAPKMSAFLDRAGGT